MSNCVIGPGCVPLCVPMCVCVCARRAHVPADLWALLMLGGDAHQTAHYRSEQHRVLLKSLLCNKEKTLIRHSLLFLLLTLHVLTHLWDKGSSGSIKTSDRLKEMFQLLNNVRAVRICVLESEEFSGCDLDFRELLLFAHSVYEVTGLTLFSNHSMCFIFAFIKQ